MGLGRAAGPDPDPVGVTHEDELPGPVNETDHGSGAGPEGPAEPGPRVGDGEAEVVEFLPPHKRGVERRSPGVVIELDPMIGAWERQMDPLPTVGELAASDDVEPHSAIESQ